MIRGFKCRFCGATKLDDTEINGLSCHACEKADALYHDINVKGGKLDPFAWPGGYPILYADDGGSTYCAECAASERDGDNIRGTLVHGIHYEGPSDFCEVCGKEIESAYGDPDAKEERP